MSTRQGGARLRNLTEHAPLRVFASRSTPVVLTADEPPARCEEQVTPEDLLHVNGFDVPLVRIAYGRVTNLPDPVDGTYLVVSQIVARALPQRHDLVVPTDLVRDASGAITGCRALARFDDPADTKGQDAGAD